MASASSSICRTCEGWRGLGRRLRLPRGSARRTPLPRRQIACGIWRRRAILPSTVGDLRHQVRVVGQERRADQVARGVGVDRQPIAKARPALVVGRAANEAGAGRGEEVHEPGHRGVVALEDARCRRSTDTSSTGRSPRRRPRPGRRPSARRSCWARPAALPPCASCASATSCAHLVMKPATSMLKAAVRDEDLDVAGPAQPLVALRTVGGHIHEIAFLAPHDVVLQLVEQRIGALEVAGASHVRVQHDAGHRVAVDRVRDSPALPRSGSRGR